MQPITIGNQQVFPGEQKRIDIPVALLPTQTMMSMPVYVVRGKHPGPSLWISAAIHGDEINGVDIINKVLRECKQRAIKGCLIAVPIVNVFGFTQQSRYLPDRRDLNRFFPGKPQGPLASRLAHLFMQEIVANATHGIDIHTSAVPRANLPHIRVEQDDRASMAMAKAFNPPLILTNRPTKGTLRLAVSRIGKPNILLEVGEALRFDEAYIADCVTGVLRVMANLNMLKQSFPRPEIESSMAGRTYWHRAKHGGLFHATVRLGERVAPGSVIGRITDPLGTQSTRIKSKRQGLVISMTKNPLVYQGDALINLAVEEDQTPEPAL